ncbi:MAG: hypothetical protein Q7S46_12635 [Gallionella sp.]|nr:hypothetical protein [Gallionella sp.]
MRMIFVLLALVAMVNTAIAEPQPNAGAVEPAVTLPVGHVPIAAVPASIPLTRKGKVLEVLDSSAYTYLKVTGDKAPVWLAAYKINIAKGAIVNYSDGVAMSNFHSKSLNRTFDTLIFVDRVEPEKK